MSQEDLRSPVPKLLDDLRAGRIGRRDFLRQVVAAGVSSAAAYSLLGQSEARAQQVTTYAVGEETSPPVQRPPGQVTTQALGEESSPPQMTTQALGEESSPPQMTTQAVGEEASPPQATTRALGEESPPPPQMTTRAIGEESNPPQMTTFALGEETNSRPPTTWALGEESQPGRPGGYRQPGPYPGPRSRWRSWYRW